MLYHVVSLFIILSSTRHVDLRKVPDGPHMFLHHFCVLNVARAAVQPDCFSSGMPVLIDMQQLHDRQPDSTEMQLGLLGDGIFSRGPQRVPFSLHYTSSGYFDSARRVCLHGLFSGCERKLFQPVTPYIKLFLISVINALIARITLQSINVFVPCL